MKKLIAVITLITMLIGSCMAYAEVDLSQYDDKALIDLLNLVQQEIVNRKIVKSANLPTGSYKVNKDIPAGVYDIYCKYDGGWWADIIIKDSEGTEKFSGTVFSPDDTDSSIHGEGTWHITLEEGDTLKITYPCVLTISAGVLFQ